MSRDALLSNPELLSGSWTHASSSMIDFCRAALLECYNLEHLAESHQRT